VARLILDETQVRDVRIAYVWWHIALVGIGVGVIYWGLTVIIGQFVIDPLFCRASVNAIACTQSVSIAGNVSTILAATIGLGVLVRLRAYRPIIIAVASAVLLWGLAGWTDALVWGEVLAWSTLSYGLSYVLFSWMSRYSRTVVVMVAVAIVLIVGRILLVL
jgi:hypothetical protein